MKLLIRTRFLAASALALAAFGAASAAHARSDVYLSFGVQPAPGVYMEPAPVYVQPQPVYIQPPPVYVAPRRVYLPPPAYAAPTEIYVRRGPPTYEYSYEDERAHSRAEWQHRYWAHRHHDWDQYRSLDRDRD